MNAYSALLCDSDEEDYSQHDDNDGHSSEHSFVLRPVVDTTTIPQFKMCADPWIRPQDTNIGDGGWSVSHFLVVNVPLHSFNNSSAPSSFSDLDTADQTHFKEMATARLLGLITEHTDGFLKNGSHVQQETNEEEEEETHEGNARTRKKQKKDRTIFNYFRANPSTHGSSPMFVYTLQWIMQRGDTNCVLAAQFGKLVFDKLHSDTRGFAYLMEKNLKNRTLVHLDEARQVDPIEKKWAEHGQHVWGLYRHVTTESELWSQLDKYGGAHVAPDQDSREVITRKLGLASNNNNHVLSPERTLNPFHGRTLNPNAMLAGLKDQQGDDLDIYRRQVDPGIYYTSSTSIFNIPPDLQENWFFLSPGFHPLTTKLPPCPRSNSSASIRLLNMWVEVVNRQEGKKWALDASDPLTVKEYNACMKKADPSTSASIEQEASMRIAALKSVSGIKGSNSAESLHGESGLLRNPQKELKDELRMCNEYVERWRSMSVDELRHNTGHASQSEYESRFLKIKCQYEAAQSDLVTMGIARADELLANNATQLPAGLVHRLKKGRAEVDSRPNGSAIVQRTMTDARLSAFGHLCSLDASWLTDVLGVQTLDTYHWHGLLNNSFIAVMDGVPKYATHLFGEAQAGKSHYLMALEKTLPEGVVVGAGSESENAKSAGFNPQDGFVVWYDEAAQQFLTQKTEVGMRRQEEVKQRITNGKTTRTRAEVVETPTGKTVRDRVVTTRATEVMIMCSNLGQNLGGSAKGEQNPMQQRFQNYHVRQPLQEWLKQSSMDTARALSEPENKALKSDLLTLDYLTTLLLFYGNCVPQFEVDLNHPRKYMQRLDAELSSRFDMPDSDSRLNQKRENLLCVLAARHAAFAVMCCSQYTDLHKAFERDDDGLRPSFNSQDMANCIVPLKMPTPEIISFAWSLEKCQHLHSLHDNMALTVCKILGMDKDAAAKRRVEGHSAGIPTSVYLTKDERNAARGILDGSNQQIEIERALARLYNRRNALLNAGASYYAENVFGVDESSFQAHMHEDRANSLPPCLMPSFTELEMFYTSQQIFDIACAFTRQGGPKDLDVTAPGYSFLVNDNYFDLRWVTSSKFNKPIDRICNDMLFVMKWMCHVGNNAISDGLQNMISTLQISCPQHSTRVPKPVGQEFGGQFQEQGDMQGAAFQDPSNFGGFGPGISGQTLNGQYGGSTSQPNICDNIMDKVQEAINKGSFRPIRGYEEPCRWVSERVVKHVGTADSHALAWNSEYLRRTMELHAEASLALIDKEGFYYINPSTGEKHAVGERGQLTRNGMPEYYAAMDLYRISTVIQSVTWHGNSLGYFVQPWAQPAHRNRPCLLEVGGGPPSCYSRFPASSSSVSTASSVEVDKAQLSKITGTCVSDKEVRDYNKRMSGKEYYDDMSVSGEPQDAWTVAACKVLREKGLECTFDNTNAEGVRTFASYSLALLQEYRRSLLSSKNITRKQFEHQCMQKDNEFEDSFSDEEDETLCMESLARVEDELSREMMHTSDSSFLESMLGAC